LQQDGKLYLTEEEWDVWRKKHEVENHSGGGARSDRVGKGHGRDRGHGHGSSSSGRSSNKPTDDECRWWGKMGHWEHECHSKSKKEQAHIAQDEEKGWLLLMTVTLTRLEASLMLRSAVEAISSWAEIELEEKMFVHLDEEKERNAGRWVLDTEATNHMFGSRTTFTKLNIAVLGTVHSGDDSVARIEGYRIVVFVYKNGEPQSLKGVYFIPRLVWHLSSRLNRIDKNTHTTKVYLLFWKLNYKELQG
jgi:hypothetical protein